MPRSHLSLPAMFFDAALGGGSKPRYLSKRSGRYEPTTWIECRTTVEEIAAGLISLGVGPGDRVAIISQTRHEWMEADLAALTVGAVTVPIYPSNLAAECGFILEDSGATTVFVDTPAQAAKVRDAASGLEFDGRQVAVDLRHLILFEGRGEGTLGLAELRERGREALAGGVAGFAETMRMLSRDDLATIVYTSGTTGVPKGVPQTHGNHLAALEAIATLGAAEPGEIDFSFLPMAHSFGRMLEYLGIFLGTVTAYAESIDTVMRDIAATKPHLVPAVPRIFEKVFAGVQAKREGLTFLARAAFDQAYEVGQKRADLVNQGMPVPAWLEALDRVAHELVFAQIHERLGGRVRYFMSGGAPLADEINSFFHAIGLPVLEGYGLTETTPILTCNRPGAVRIGTVGTALPGVELKIAPDGEILARGPNVTTGYYRRPEETAASWDDDGWFHTGDIGELTQGFLRITDRKKELIKTAGGKYVAPQKIENLLKARPLISQAVVVGDRRKYCVALLTVDPDECRAFGAARAMDGLSVGEIAESREMHQAVGKEVEAVNRELSSFELIKYFRVLPMDFAVETGELTPSLKVKRKVVADRHAAKIEALYG